MTTCKQCENHVDVDMNLDTSAVICYSSKSPHYCNYFKRPLSVHEATEMIYRTRCEGFKDGRVTPKEEAKPMTDWVRLEQLSADLALCKKILDFCENYEGAQIGVTLTSHKVHSPQSFEVTLTAPPLLRLVIKQLWAEQDAALEVLKDIVKDVER